MEYDYLIVGSGLFGSTFANLAKKDGKKVLVIDSRYHQANCARIWNSSDNGAGRRI